VNPPWQVPLVTRGEIIDSREKVCASSRPGVDFMTVDAAAHLEKLTIRPERMLDLTALRFTDVLEYLDALARHLHPATNPHILEAYELSKCTSLLSDSTLRHTYEQIPELFSRDCVERRARALLPLECLDGWYTPPEASSRHTKVRIRSFGARILHIIAGNTPAIAAVTILNNALTRGDALIKSPSNDPLTAVAIARTMLEMEPNHPLTRHLAVAYWKGGDARVERFVYDSRRIEKIVAWGGLASIRHVTRELPPGLDLITFNPKRGLAILDASALLECSDKALGELAARLALDIGSLSQEACFNTRLVYLLGKSPQAASVAHRLATLTYQALQHLPATLSSPHRAFDPELRAEIEALRITDSDHTVIGGHTSEGAIIVSAHGEPVEFAHRLACRVANFIVVSSLDAVLCAIGPWAQTVVVYPATLKRTLRDSLALHGVQRIVSPGGATMDPDLNTPQDGMEILRRMCKWVVEEYNAHAIE
jgi:acyl-CoA reductase LuxC